MSVRIQHEIIQRITYKTTDVGWMLTGLTEKIKKNVASVFDMAVCEGCLDVSGGGYV